MSDTDNRTGTQRIEDLEKVVAMLYQNAAKVGPAIEHLMKGAGEMPLVLDALKLLNKKTEAIIQAATAEGGITVATVSALVVQMNVADLTAQVAGFVANGHLVPTDTVATDSYLVCEEWSAEGALVNPRIQFRMDSQDPTTTALLVGKKVGELVAFGENKFSAKVIEIYSIVEPVATEAAAPAAPTPDAAPAAAPAASPPPEAEAAPAAAAPLPELPAETPVQQFVASDPATMTTASST